MLLYSGADGTGTTYQPEITIYEDGGVVGTKTLSTGSAGSELWVTAGTNGEQLYHYNLQLILETMGDDGILSGGSSGGATYGRITYETTIQNEYEPGYVGGGEKSIDQGDVLQAADGETDVQIFGDVYNAADSTFTGSLEADESCDSLSIVTGQVDKEIVAINGVTDKNLWEKDDAGRPRISPGDTVSYHLSYDMPISSTEDFKLIDFLPLPVFDAADPDADGTDNDWSKTDSATYEAGEWHFTADHTYQGVLDTTTVNESNNTLIFDWFPYYDTNNASSTVDLVFTIQVSDAEFADGLFLTNQVTATEQGTLLADSVTNDIIQIVLDQPGLEITKGVVATNNDAGSFDAVVGPVTFTDPGSSGVRWSGSITETGLDTTPVDANLSNIDAGDLVTFAIVVENVGKSDAYDIAITDNLPPGFAVPTSAQSANGLNLSVTNGAGNNIAYTINGGGLSPDFFLNGITLVDSAGGALKANSDADTAQTENILVITYDLVATGEVQPSLEIINTAAISNYAGRDGGTSFDTAGLDDGAVVTIASPSVVKTVVSTSHDHTDGSNVAIGEIITYKVTLTVPEGTSPSVTFEDDLGAGLALVSVDSISSTFITTDNILDTLNVTNSGQKFTLDFGTIENTDRDNDIAETITITYQAVATNVGSSERGTDLENEAKWVANGVELTTGTAEVNVVEPILTVVKEISDPTPDANDEVTFTITVSNDNDANGADAFEVSLIDTVPDGYTYESGSWSLVSGTAVTTLSDTGGVLEATWDTFAQGASATFTFKATVNSVTAGQNLSNTVDIDWTSLPGDKTDAQSTHTDVSTERTGNPSDPGGNANDHRASSTAEVIITGAIDKQVPDPTSYTIGDTVTYDIVVTLPEAEINSLVVTDALPDGLTYTGHSIDLTGLLIDGGGTPTVTVDPATGIGSNDITFSFDDFTVTDDNDPTNDSFTIQVEVLVENVSTNYANATLTNEASMSYLDPDGNAVTVEDPTDPTITLVEPQITTTKTVVDKDGTSTDTEADVLNDIMTYTVVMENTGTGTAYEVSLADKLPDGTELVGVTSITASPGGGAVETDIGAISFTNTNGLLGFSHESWDLQVGETLTIKYDVRVVEAWFVGGDHTNSADADWTGRDGVNDNERIYDDSDTRNPGMSQDGTQDAAEATFTVPSGNGTIGDTVWFDANADGIQDAGETGIVGVTVTAQVRDPDNPDKIVYEHTTTTDSLGNYSFTDLPDAVYEIRVDPSTLPAGMTQTYDYAVDQDTNVLDHTGTHTITGSASGETFLDVDFGYTGIGSIGDYVWYDANQDGVQNEANLGINGATVTITGDLDGDGVFEYTATATTGDDGSGNPGYYLFENLPFADYTITVSNLPKNVTEPTFDFDGIATPNTAAVSKDAISATNDIRNIDFGYVGTGLIGDTVWNDINADGVQDPGENGLSGVTVTLSGVDLNNDGTPDTLTTVTGTDGSYEFAGLPPGAYTVTVDSSTIPSGYTQSGDPDTVKDHSSTYDLALGEVNRDQDFGYTETGSIGDTLWYDIDGDGVQDVNEPGLAGIEVTLRGDVDLDGNPDTFTTVTDNNGKYLFDNLPTGEYSITVNGDDLPAGMVPTYDEDGIDTLHTADVALGTGDDNLDIDFGYRGTGSIGDTVWHDLNEDGVVNPQEEGIGGVKITLEGDFDGDGVTDIVLKTVTDANGNYSFGNLFAGEYSITTDFSSVPGKYYPVYDADGILDNTTTVTLGAGEVNTEVDFGYKPVPVQLRPSTPSEVVPPVEVVTPYDPLFRSYVEGVESRDVQSFIDLRRDDSVFAEPLLPVSPIYTGHAEPGTTLRINLSDAQGNFVGSELVMADTGGNWLANFSGTLLYDMPHRIEIQQDMSLYNASSAGGFNLRTYFMPALGMSPFTMSDLTLESIFATQPFAILEVLGEHYNQGVNLAWDDFYDYEYIAVSTNPAQSTL